MAAEICCSCCPLAMYAMDLSATEMTGAWNYAAVYSRRKLALFQLTHRAVDACKWYINTIETQTSPATARLPSGQR
jgi:hypothetical protein